MFVFREKSSRKVSRGFNVFCDKFYAGFNKFQQSFTKKNSKFKQNQTMFQTYSEASLPPASYRAAFAYGDEPHHCLSMKQRRLPWP